MSAISHRGMVAELPTRISSPVLPLSLNFTAMANGASIAPLIGTTFAVAGGVLVNTPTVGANLLTDGDMEAAGLTAWPASGTPVTREKSTTQAHGGTQSLHIVADANAEGAIQGVAVTNGKWYQATEWGYLAGGDRLFLHHDIGGLEGLTVSTPNVWTNGRQTRWCLTNATGSMYARAYPSGVNGDGYCDDYELRELLLASLYAYAAAGVSDVIARAAARVQPLTQVGVILNIDNPAAPLNYVVAFGHRSATGGGIFMYLLKCVNGAFSAALINGTSVTYVAGAFVELRKSGTTYSLYYNNAQVGTDQTISDAGIVNNTVHGLLSTDGGCSVDSFFLDRN